MVSTQISNFKTIPVSNDVLNYLAYSSANTWDFPRQLQAGITSVQAEFTYSMQNRLCNALLKNSKLQGCRCCLRIFTAGRLPLGKDSAYVPRGIPNCFLIKLYFVVTVNVRLSLCKPRRHASEWRCKSIHC
jgi:hypothetical protein